MKTQFQTLVAAITQDAPWQWGRVKAAIAASCAGCRVGRVLLHMLCACGDRHFRWHFEGIAREFVSYAQLPG